MKALVIDKIVSIKENPKPLKLIEMQIPQPAADEVLIKVSACGVCHTELDEIEGRTKPPHLPIVPGHEVVGRVVKMGADVKDIKIDDRVGVGWIYASCGGCEFCLNGKENLCIDFKATGRDANGGYAEYMLAKENFVFLIPTVFSDAEAAPLLCAGGVGYRSLELTNIKDGQNLGLTGFGASGHLVLKLVKHLLPQTKIYVFARNKKQQQFARELGAVWAGDTEEEPAEKMHAIIDTTPVWKPVVKALKNLKPGGRLVINAIRKEDVDKEFLLNLSYHKHLWLEKEIKTIANVTKNDITRFLELAAAISLKPQIAEYSLLDANLALYELKTGKVLGAKVLVL